VTPAPVGTTADSAAAAGFRALIAATPGAARYCLAIGNPPFYRDPGAPGVPSSLDASEPLLALVAQGRPRGAPPLAPASACEREPAPSAARIEISHLLPLGETAVHITATASSREERLLYACRVVRPRGGEWVAAEPCRRVGIID
jgi:hypothetical protein